MEAEARADAAAAAAWRSARVAAGANALIKAMASGSEAEVQDALTLAPDELSELVRGTNHAGMTPTHMASRLRRPEWLDAFLHADRDSASLVTFTTGKPEGWTPLHCVLDATPSGAGQESELL